MQVAMVGVGAIGAITLGFWRGGLYGLSPAAWALSFAAGVISFVWTLSAQRRRGRAFAGVLPLVLAAAFLLEVFRRRIGIPAELGVALVFFGGGALLATSISMTAEVVARWREGRRLLAATGSLTDPSAKGQVADYFRAAGRLNGHLDSPGKAVRRALGRLSSAPGPSWNEAAAALRTYAAALGTYRDLGSNVPHPRGLDALARQCETAMEAMQETCLRAAAELEANRRPDVAEVWAANRHVLEAGRRWQYAIGLLASRHRVSVPRWFIRLNAQFAKAG